MLAEISTTNKEWIITFHEHDSLLENVEEQKLTEDEKKAAWEDYENEKKGINMNSKRCRYCASLCKVTKTIIATRSGKVILNTGQMSI